MSYSGIRNQYRHLCELYYIDLGFYEIRNVVSIPVAFLAENSLHIACILANKFSVLCWNKALSVIADRTIRQYGLSEKFIPAETFDITEDEALEGFRDATSIVERVKDISNKVIASGAGILVPFCNIMNVLLHSVGLTEIEGVPILNTTAMIVKGIEFLVELDQIGIKRSESGFYSALAKDDLVSVRKAFALE